MSAVMTPGIQVPTRWRTALPALGLLLLGILLIFRDTFTAMHAIWARSDTFAHAYLVPPITLWLVWRRRHALAGFTPRPQPLWLLPMAAVAGIWLLGDMAGVNSVTQLCVTAMLVLAVPTLLGWQVARQLTFPLVFLFFMVPVGEFLLPLMMEATADFAVAAVAASGVPVYREGLNFIIPSGAWSVVEACSGVRYLIASFMVGTLFAYLNFSTPWRRWVFVGVAILVPVLANWLRAYMIVMLGHLSGNTIAVGVDHLIYGWLFFGIVIGLMFMIGARWSEPDGVNVTEQPDRAGLAPVIAAPAALWSAALAALVLLALPQVAAWRLAHPAAMAAPVLQLPELAGTRAASQDLALQPVFPGAAVQASRVYGTTAGPITVHVAYYRRQGYGAKLASSDNTLLRSNDHRWNRLRGGNRTLVVGADRVDFKTVEFVANNNQSYSGRSRLEVRQTYWANERFTASDNWATALGVLGRLAGRGDDGAVITFYAEGEPAHATAAVDGFIAQHLAAIQAQLSAVRAAH